MSQVLINKNLLNRSVYDQILIRMNKIRLRTETTISYYKSTQQLLKIYYENNRSMHEDFQEGTRNSSFYSNTWCSEVTRTLHQIKDVVSGLEKCTILNIERLDKFSQQNARKTNTKLDKQINRFCDHLIDYSQKSGKIEKKINAYKDQVSYVRGSINKYQNLQDPIHFYNPTQFLKSVSKLDEKFKSLQEKQSLLVGQVDIMQMEKKCLQNSMKELKDATVKVLSSQSSCLQEMVMIIVEGSQQRYQTQQKINRMSSANEDLYSIQLANMQKIYQKWTNIKDNASFNNPFPGNIQVSQIDSNLKLYEQRCKNLISLRKSYLFSSHQFVLRIKSFLSKILNEMQNIKKKYNEIVVQVIGPTNKMQKFKKDIWKYLGEKQIQMFNLSEIIISSRPRAFNSIFKKINGSFKEIEKKISQKGQMFTSFEQSTFKILSSHSILKRSIEQSKTVTEDLYEEYQNSIRNSFSSLITLFEETKQKQQELYKYLNNAIRQIVSIYMHEVDTFSYNNIAADNKNLIDALKKKNDEDQIKENMNKDQRYQVLFNPFFYQNTSKQRMSSTVREDYSKVRDLLQKKNYIASMGNKYTKKGNSFTCCVAKPPSQSIHPKAITQCRLQNKTDMIQGTLKVYPQCLIFQTKRNFFKEQKIILLIPKKELTEIEKKQVTTISQNALQISTQMGDITFHDINKLGEIYDSVNKIIDNQKRQNKNNIDDMNNNSMMSKHSRKNSRLNSQKWTPNTSRQIKIRKRGYSNVQQILVSPNPSVCIQSTSAPQPKLDVIKLNKGLKDLQILKESVNVQLIKRVYEVKILNLKYTVKQIRKISRQDKNLQINMKWKGECKSNSHTFKLFQNLTINLNDTDKILMNVVLQNGQYLDRYIEGYFKKLIVNMNVQIMNNTSEIFSKQCQLFIEETQKQFDHVQDNPKLIKTIHSSFQYNYKQMTPITPIVHLQQKDKNSSNTSFKQQFKLDQRSQKIIQEIPTPIDSTKQLPEQKTNIYMYFALIPLCLIMFKLLGMILNF